MRRASLSATERMSFDDFMAFARERPDGERWELVDGLPVLNASPTDVHHVIVVKLTTVLTNAKARRSADWIALPGHTVRVLSEGWAPNPDVVVRSDRLTGQVFTAEPIIAFEVASPSNRRADRLRRLEAYRAAPSLAHYVLIEQSTVCVTRHDRDAGFEPVVITDPEAALDLPAIGVAIPLADIYRWTSLDIGPPPEPSKAS